MIGGKHIQCVVVSDEMDLLHIHEIEEKLVFIDIDQVGCYVVRNPNLHGHAVFK